MGHDHNILPSSQTQCFMRSNDIHNYETRGGLNGNVFHTKVNAFKYGIRIQILRSRSIKQLAETRHLPGCKNKTVT